MYAEEDEEELRELKAHLASRNDPDAAVALKVINWCEETEEPDPMLKRLHDWLHAKGNDPIAVLVGWWLTEFEKMQEEDHPSATPAATLH